MRDLILAGLGLGLIAWVLFRVWREDEAEVSDGHRRLVLREEQRRRLEQDQYNRKTL